MRFYYILLVIAVTIVASTNVGSTIADATLTTPHIVAHSSTARRDSVSTTRMLKTDRKQDGEERAGNIAAGNVPFSTKLVNWAISPKSAEAKLTLREKYKVEKWLFAKKDSKYVFNRLKLGEGVDNSLSNPKLHVYVAYIDRFNKQNPTKRVTLIDMFTHTNTDDAMARMIEAGMNTPRTKTIATRMQQELLDSWKSQGKAAEEVFTLLKIDTAKYNLFKTPKISKDSNPALNIFAAYIDMLNKQNPTNKVKMIDIFTMKYSDDVIAKMVAMWLKVLSTKKVATTLRSELLAKWEDSVESADDIFKLLKLDKAGDDLFASPEFNILYAYTKMTYVLDPKTVLLKVLSDHYGYDGLSKIFEVGYRRVDMAFLAKDLENAMVAQWLKEQISPDKLFKLLNLDDNVDTLLSNSNFLRTWASYRLKFNSENNASITIMETLRTFYSYKDLSSMLTSAAKVPATKDIATLFLKELRIHNLRAPPMRKTS